MNSVEDAPDVEGGGSHPTEVMTVLGPVPPGALGVTLAHEHVFFDLSCYFTPAGDDRDGALAEASVAPERLWWLRAHPMNNRDNLVQNDVNVASEEVGLFAAAGGGTLVDVTTVGIAPNPLGLAAVSRRTGVHIVAGTGFYTGPSYLPLVGELSQEQIEDHLRRELAEGIAGTTVRAGLIGELGAGNPPLPIERRVFAAAARVQQERGCAVTLHPAWGSAGALLAGRLADEAGLDPAYTAISHLDNRLRGDVAGVADLARRGFWLSFDCFGRDLYYPHVDEQLPSDAERIRLLLGVLDAGYGHRLLLSQDICFQHELVRHGGHGYAHVLRTIRERLLCRGVGSQQLDAMLIANPRTWLTGRSGPDLAGGGSAPAQPPTTGLPGEGF